jgi:hypothetical protein
MSADLTNIDEWLWDTFSGDLQLNTAVGGRIYANHAPQGAAMPLVIYAFLGGSDRVQTFRSRFTNAIYLIRAVTQGSTMVAIKAIADRMDELLTVPTQGVTVGDVLISTVIREQPHERADMENGVPVVYLGGFYRFRYQPQT